MSPTSILVQILCVFMAFVSGEECAYSSMGILAVPLDVCTVYSMEDTTSISYSSKYIFDADSNTLQWNYYNDLECNTMYKTYEMDDVMMNIHHMSVQSDGDGANCETVSVTVSGSYDDITDECDTDVITNDYYSKQYVINQCVSSQLEQSSAVLLCDEEKIYFNYYQDCPDCNCMSEAYVYEYYADKQQGCYDVVCNAQIGDNILNHYMSSDVSSVIKKISDDSFVKNFIAKPPNTPINFAKEIGSFTTSTEREMAQSFSITYLSLAVISILAVVYGIYRYIKGSTKEYSQI